MLNLLISSLRLAPLVATMIDGVNLIVAVVMTVLMARLCPPCCIPLVPTCSVLVCTVMFPGRLRAGTPFRMR